MCVGVPTGFPGRGLRGDQRQTRAHRQTEDIGSCREGVRREDEHPGPPPQQQRGTHRSPGTRLSSISSCNPHEADAL